MSRGVCVYTGPAPIPPTRFLQLGCLDLTNELCHMSSVPVCVCVSECVWLDVRQLKSTNHKQANILTLRNPA